jgi:hypothetical protein
MVVSAALIAGCVLVSGAASASIIVPGTANIWAWNGSVGSIDASGGDTYPAVAPTLAVSDLSGAASIHFDVSGSTGNCPGCEIANGTGALYSHNDGAINGVPDLTAPINSLVGVWIDANNQALDQSFVIGTGGDFVVPDGATQLYLGSMDGYQWNNNVGQFVVDLTITPDDNTPPDDGNNPPDDGNPPTTPAPEPLTLSLFGAGLAGLGAMRRRRKAA